MIVWPDLEVAVRSAAPGGRMLEIGTGRGSFFRYLLQLLEENRHLTLTTLDADPTAAAAARDLLAAKERRGLRP